MDRLRTLGECALGVALLAGVIVVGYGVLGMICQRAMVVAWAG